jgi:hypothetical protein
MPAYSLAVVRCSLSLFWFVKEEFRFKVVFEEKRIFRRKISVIEKTAQNHN